MCRGCFLALIHLVRPTNTQYIGCSLPNPVNTASRTNWSQLKGRNLWKSVLCIKFGATICVFAQFRFFAFSGSFLPSKMQTIKPAYNANQYKHVVRSTSGVVDAVKP